MRQDALQTETHEYKVLKPYSFTFFSSMCASLSYTISSKSILQFPRPWSWFFFWKSSWRNLCMDWKHSHSSFGSGIRPYRPQHDYHWLHTFHMSPVALTQTQTKNPQQNHQWVHTFLIILIIFSACSLAHFYSTNFFLSNVLCWGIESGSVILMRITFRQENEIWSNDILLWPF